MSRHKSEVQSESTIIGGQYRNIENLVVALFVHYNFNYKFL
jgi:hypothetical protein